MPKCRDCRWAQVDLGNPNKGVCLYGSREASAEETSSSESQRILVGKPIEMRAEACENFEAKPSRRQRLSEGF